MNNPPHPYLRMVKHDPPDLLHNPRNEQHRGPRVEDPYPDASRIFEALLPTWKTPAASRVRDTRQLISALRNPTACGIVADLLEHRAGAA